MIEPYTHNPRYWQYRGEPVMLLGATDDDNAFQMPHLRQQLDTLAAAGGNVIRNTMSDRNEWGYEIYPYARRPDGQYDLNVWNEQYWDRFESMLAMTAERKIIVQIEVWDRFDYTDAKQPRHWLAHPYNPRNNVNYTTARTGLSEGYPDHPGLNRQPFFFTTPWQRHNPVLLAYQVRFVDRMLEHSLRYDHVLYCMDNETKAEERWGMYWAMHIRRAAERMGRRALVTEMWDDWVLMNDRHKQTLDRPGLYDFVDVSQNNQRHDQEHWDNFQWARAYITDRPRPLNTTKTYGADSGVIGDSDDGVERWWRHVIGGAASARFHRPVHGLGLCDRTIACIRAARLIETRAKFWDMEPGNDRLVDRADNAAYLTCNPGQAYVVFFINGGKVGLRLDEAAASMRLEWIDIAAGAWHGSPQTVEPTDVLQLTAPGDKHWIAVITAAAE